MLNHTSYRTVLCDLMVDIFREKCFSTIISLVKICKVALTLVETMPVSGNAYKHGIGLFWKLTLKVYFLMHL